MKIALAAHGLIVPAGAISIFVRARAWRTSSRRRQAEQKGSKLPAGAAKHQVLVLAAALIARNPPVLAS